MATADSLERQAALKAALDKVDWNSPFFKQTPPPKAKYTTFPGAAEWGAARNAITTSGMGANRPSNPKSWESMTDYEKKAELDKVDWNSPFFQQGGGGGGGGGTGGGGGGGTSTPTPTPAAEVPITIMPVGDAPAPVSNTQALSDMYAQALQELSRQYGVSQENINAAIGRMRTDPYNMANAYANMQLADPRVAANPVAEYMAAAGMAPGQAAAAQQMAQAEADAYQRAMQNVQNIMSTSQQQANLSRLADIGLIETGAAQDLESNLNMLRLGLEKERIGSIAGLQQQNLQNDLQMRNAIASQISSIFSGQDVAPESILKLIEQALAKINTSRWTDMPSPMVTIQPVGSPTPYTPGV